MSFVRRAIALPGRGHGSISYLDFGNPDRPVDLVFMHATGFNALTYRRLIEPMPEIRVLVVDQRGHGFTTLPTPSESLRNWFEFRDDLVAFLTLLDLQRVVLSGHSMGGTVSLFAAVEAPERVSRLVLLDPVVPPIDRRILPGDAPPPISAAAARRRADYPDRQTAIAAYTGRGAFTTWPEEILADYVDGGFVDLRTGGVTLTCRPQWEAATFAAQDHDAWAAFHQSVCPIRILRAESESTCGVNESSSELTDSGRISIETVPATSHFVPMERQELCRAALMSAIAAR